MFKTTALNSVANEYVDKDIPLVIPGTRLEADDRNITQDELVNAVEDKGLTLDATGVDRNQLSQAIDLVSGRMAQRDSDTVASFITSSTSFQDTGLQIDFTNIASANPRKIFLTGTLESEDSASPSAESEVKIQVNYGAGWVDLKTVTVRIDAPGATTAAITVPLSMWEIDAVSDASPQYKVVLRSTGASETTTLTNAELIVEEETV